MLWSILITAIPERYHSVQPLLHSLLETQSVARRPDVELLYLMDSKRRTVGEKRNALLDMAVGEYVTFIDDDDEVSPDYVERIYRTIVECRKGDNPADVICFPQRATIQPHNVIHECSYSLEHWRKREPDKRRQMDTFIDENGKPVPSKALWTGPPAHTMAWRRAILKDVRFPAKNCFEDSDFVDAACAVAKTEKILNGHPLYFYKFSETGSATR